MARYLVIVESPAKAKTINKYLGKDFLVKSSIGHIRDLPSGGESEEDPLAKAREAQAKLRAAGKTKLTPAEKATKAKTALIRRMGVDPEHGWEARYEIVPGKEKVVDELRAAAAKAEAVYLASDLDREGEAIAWHLREVIGGPADRFRRVTFSEITKPAIQAAFERPGDIDMPRVEAQQARRFLDRVVGFQVSPLLWAKVARGLSAGRVQSVAVRLVVEREREIHAFVPEEYWEVWTALDGRQPLRAQVVREDGKPFRPTSKTAADAAVKALNAAEYAVADLEQKAQRSFPSAPFITSSLQRAASIRLGFSVKKTMTLAQRLYEAGHITYMRTDSVNLSADALTAVRARIQSQFGAKYLPAEPVRYASKEGAQEAHEAIRPTDPAVRADDLDAEPDAQRLYDLIWRQTLASQMPPAEFDTALATIRAGRHELAVRGRVLRFDGWQKVLPPAKQEDQPLPPLTVGERLRLKAVEPTQHFTKPPPRYSEGSLVTELEKRGIGRPSTYGAIITTIQDRGYVRLEGRRFHAEKLGDVVTGRLQQAFPELMDYGFTAGLEGDLDRIAEGSRPWKQALDAFYKDFKAKLATADETMERATVHPTDIDCPTCGRKMGVRTAKTGVFLSCSGYDLPPKEKCSATINLVRGDEAVGTSDDGESEEGSDADARDLRARRRCHLCGTAMDAWLVDKDRKLHICGRNPDCGGTVIETGSFRIRGYEGPTIECDKCGKPMQLKTGRFGKYFGCTGYPVCANTRKLLRSGEAAPPKAKPVGMPELPCTKGGHFVLRDGAAGIFLASNLYPKVRETRNPLVRELAAHRAELDPKHHHLADGPQADAKGNPVVIRYSRSDKAQYLSAERDGEPTGEQWWWEGGRWVARTAAAKPAKAPAKKR